MKEMESLQGYFLIATPHMPDPRFREQVVYLCAHSTEGAIGLVINCPFKDITLADIFKSAELEAQDIQFPPVYCGGPVEMESGFFLYSSEYETPSSMAVSSTVRLSRDPMILHDIASGNGPRRYIFCLGYAGWAPGQLENELGLEGWLTLPGEDEVLFDTPDEVKWKKAAELFGIDITTFGDVVGSA